MKTKKSTIFYHCLISLHPLVWNTSHLFIKKIVPKQTIISYSTDTEIDYDHKRISEIISSIKHTDNFKIAFIHKSARLTYKENKSYDLLEFLGDSILEFYIRKALFIFFPNYNEGELTTFKTLLVERKNLAILSKQIELDKYLVIDKNIEKSKKILADIYESFIAALYIEKGEEILQEFLILTIFNRPETKDFLKDYKLSIQSKQEYKIPTDNNLTTNINKNLKDKLPLISNPQENKILLNQAKEIIFKFEDKTNNTKIIEEQNDLLQKILNSQDSNFSFINLILKQLSSLKEIVFIIKTFEENLNNKILDALSYFNKEHNLNKQTKENIYKQLISTDNHIKELNNNLLYSNKIIKNELTKFNSKLSWIILLLSIPLFLAGSFLLYWLYNNWEIIMTEK